MCRSRPTRSTRICPLRRRRFHPALLPPGRLHRRTLRRDHRSLGEPPATSRSIRRRQQRGAWTGHGPRSTSQLYSDGPRSTTSPSTRASGHRRRRCIRCSPPNHDRYQADSTTRRAATLYSDVQQTFEFRPARRRRTRTRGLSFTHGPERATASASRAQRSIAILKWDGTAYTSLASSVITALSPTRPIRRVRGRHRMRWCSSSGPLSRRRPGPRASPRLPGRWRRRRRQTTARASPALLDCGCIAAQAAPTSATSASASSRSPTRTAARPRTSSSKGIPGDSRRSSTSRSLRRAVRRQLRSRRCSAGTRTYPVEPLSWNGDFEDDVDGWSAAAVTNINGAATSITRQTAGVIKYGTAAAEIVCPATSGTGANFRIFRRFKKGVTYTVEGWIYSAAQVTLDSIKRSSATPPRTTLRHGGATTALSTAWLPDLHDLDAYGRSRRRSHRLRHQRSDRDDVPHRRRHGLRGHRRPDPRQPVEGRGAQPPFGLIEAESVRPGLALHMDDRERARTTVARSGSRLTMTASERVRLGRS
jgi:hypothetical protein